MRTDWQVKTKVRARKHHGPEHITMRNFITFHQIMYVLKVDHHSENIRIVPMPRESVMGILRHWIAWNDLLWKYIEGRSSLSIISTAGRKIDLTALRRPLFSLGPVVSAKALNGLM